MQYDIIVVGAGHAGIEAALAGARLGKKTLLITMLVEQITLKLAKCPYKVIIPFLWSIIIALPYPE